MMIERLERRRQLVVDTVDLLSESVSERRRLERLVPPSWKGVARPARFGTRSCSAFQSLLRCFGVIWKGKTLAVALGYSTTRTAPAAAKVGGACERYHECPGRGVYDRG